MPAQSRTPERLARGAVHVNYEVGAFRHFAASDLNDSVTIELFLLHARNLIEFLGWRASKYDDDLIANNFVAGWTPPSTPDPTFFKNVLDKIDGHLSHLTWRRVEEEQLVTPTTPAFPYDEVHDLVCTAFIDFTDQAVRDGSPGALLFSTASHAWHTKV